MAIFNNMLELVGHTPMVKINRLQGSDCNAELIAKLEFYNPASSIKDRIALSMIEGAEKTGKLRPGATIIEPTSGNTGIGLAFVAAVKGYKLIIVMPEHMSQERKTMIKGMGAELVLTPAALGITGALEKAKNLEAEIAGSVVLDQFANLDNPAAHKTFTAEEIWADCNGKIDIFVAGVGSGGTITGVGAKLKELNPNITLVAVEPAESAVLSGNPAGPHKIQGIGAGFVPSILQRNLINEIFPVKSDTAIAWAKRLMREEGILGGISSGANAFAAVQIASRPKNANKRIVFIVCDTAERYLSTELFVSA